MNFRFSTFEYWIRTRTSTVIRYFARIIVATTVLLVRTIYTSGRSCPFPAQEEFSYCLRSCAPVSELQQEPASMLDHGLIRTPSLTPEEIKRFIQLAVEAGADERNLRELAAEGTEKLLTCPEFLFAWQRNWPEYANVPELILAVKVGYEGKVHELVRRGEDPNIKHADGTTPLSLA